MNRQTTMLQLFNELSSLVQQLSMMKFVVDSVKRAENHELHRWSATRGDPLITDTYQITSSGAYQITASGSGRLSYSVETENNTETLYSGLLEDTSETIEMNLTMGDIVHLSISSTDIITAELRQIKTLYDLLVSNKDEISSCEENLIMILKDYSNGFNNRFRELNNYINSTVDLIKSYDTKLDNIIKTDTSTENNLELIDIRTDADGETHDTAGKAVRYQVNQLKYKLEEIQNLILSEDYIQYLIDNSVTKYSDDHPIPTDAHINELITEYSDSHPGLSKDDINQIIQQYLSDNPVEVPTNDKIIELIQQYHNDHPVEQPKTPQRGVDYWTEEDVTIIKNYVENAVLGGEW